MQLNLTLFRGREPQPRGGSLLICVDIGVEQAALAEAQGTMPSTRLSPLPYLRGEVQLVAPGVPAMTAPVAAGQSYVAFAHHLQPEGASFFRKIISENPAECGVVFDLAYFDARPDPAWAIQANWTEIDRLLTERAANEALTPEEIRTFVDDLIQRGDARLDFDPAWGEPGAVASDGARAWLDEFITAHFFEPSFAPGGGATPRFVRRGDGARPDDAELNARTVERHAYGQASLEEMLTSTGRSADAFVHFVDLDDLHPAPLSVQIFCNGRLGETIEMVQVNLEYGSGRQRSVTLHSPEQRATITWPFDPQAGWSYRYSYHGTYRGSGSRFESPMVIADEQVLTITPPPQLSVQIFCLGLGETIATVQVDLEYGAAGQRSVTLHSPDQPARIEWPFDPDTGSSYRYSYHGTYLGSGLPFEGAVAVEDARILVIAPPPP